MTTVHDFTVAQGATRRFDVLYKYVASLDTNGNPVLAAHDVTGCRARMQLRARHRAPLLLELTSEAGELVVGTTDGKITVTMTDEQTAALEVKRARYDLELYYPSGETARVMQGQITVDQNITEDLL